MNMSENVFQDFLKRDLSVGDYVVFPAPYGGGMKLGKIIRFTPKQLRVEWTYKSHRGGIAASDASRYSNQCVKVEGPDLTMYLLSGEY
jgi:hypothetical protein